MKQARECEVVTLECRRNEGHGALLRGNALASWAMGWDGGAVS